jgi:hypothetical protein
VGIPQCPGCAAAAVHPLGGPPWGGRRCSDGSRKRLVGKPGSASEGVSGRRQVLRLLVARPPRRGADLSRRRSRPERDGVLVRERSGSWSWWEVCPAVRGSPMRTWATSGVVLAPGRWTQGCAGLGSIRRPRGRGVHGVRPRTNHELRSTITQWIHAEILHRSENAVNGNRNMAETDAHYQALIAVLQQWVTPDYSSLIRNMWIAYCGTFPLAVACVT